jgi:hypothetical protein
MLLGFVVCCLAAVHLILQCFCCRQLYVQLCWLAFACSALHAIMFSLGWYLNLQAESCMKTLLLQFLPSPSVASVGVVQCG